MISVMITAGFGQGMTLVAKLEKMFFRALIYIVCYVH
jgi:hypothetical protein